MAESHTPAPGEGVARARDEVLATKLNAPPARPDLLPRSRLTDRLDEGMARSVTLVCTPAGFGKTTLLTDWAASSKATVAWLSLDLEDNDPVRFWRHVVVSLDRVCPGVGEHVLPILGSASVSSGQSVVTGVVNAIADTSDELALVLDDYHVIESRPIHEGMSFLLGHAPPQLHIVIASRSDPPLPLTRLRAGGQLAELRAADLRFTPEESSALLRDVWDLDLSPEATSELERRTEGWAVGLQLAALSLRELPDQDAFLHAFARTRLYVLDYLSEEVLERQPDEVRSFLLETSILERLTGPLCDEVTGRSDGQAMLERLERANLFLVPLDDERRWYRFHHLFRDLLRARLEHTRSDEVPDLHRRAVTWCERQGLIDQAIGHAAASGDADRAVRLIEEHVNETLRRAENVTLRRWLSLLPDDVVRSSPALCLAQGLTEIHVGHVDRTEALAAQAERAFLDAPGRSSAVPTDAGVVAEVPAAVALVRALIAGARGQGQAMAAFARSALEHMAEQEVAPRFLARWITVMGADWMEGRLVEAEHAYAELLAEGRAAPTPYPVMQTCRALAEVQQTQGKLGAALRTYRDGLAFATGGARDVPFLAAEAHLGIAQVLYERDQLDDARRHATESVELGGGMVQFFEQELVTSAWIHQARGEIDAALEAVTEACRMFPSPEAVGMWHPGPSERARLWLLHGRTAEAAGWTEEVGLSADDEVSFPRERDHLVLVRALLAGGDPEPALRLLERLDALAASQGRNQSLIRVRALRSLALQASGDHGGALALLADTLALARPEGFARIFADEGPSMGALLRSLIGARQRGRVTAVSDAARNHVNRVLRAFRSSASRAESAAPGATALVDPLTSRELEVLASIAAGKRNNDIAQDLVVTLETVKKHVSHILGKLGASSRTQAVARARELGLIS